MGSFASGSWDRPCAVECARRPVEGREHAVARRGHLAAAEPVELTPDRLEVVDEELAPGRVPHPGGRVVESTRSVRISPAPERLRSRLQATFNYAAPGRGRDRRLARLGLHRPARRLTRRRARDAVVSWWVVDDAVGTDLERALDELVPRWLAETWRFRSVGYYPRCRLSASPSAGRGAAPRRRAAARS